MDKLSDMASPEYVRVTQHPDQLTDAQLEALTHAQLSNLRDKYSSDSKIDQRLAPFEHQAFAREYTKENPVTGSIGLAAAIPLYQLAKGAGFMQNGGTATPASFDQVKQGYRGIAQGLGLTR